MAVNNDKVQVTAGLICTQLVDPPIGAPSASFTIGYTDGHVASDSYVTCAAATPANLNADPGGDAYIKVVNPNAEVALLKISSTTIGNLPAATPASPSVAVFPIASGVVITGTLASGGTLGVTIIRITANT